MIVAVTGLFVKFIVKNNIGYSSGSTEYFDGNLNKTYLLLKLDKLFSNFLT